MTYLERARLLHGKGEIVNAAIVLAEGLKRDRNNADAMEWFVALYVREVPNPGLETDVISVLAVQDNAANSTRFLILGRQIPPPGDTDRTSLMFSIRDEVGALHQALAPFRRFKINMTKIESRPSKRKAWEYFFFVDCDGHAESGKLAKAVELLGQHCSFVKVLGSYPNGD